VVCAHRGEPDDARHLKVMGDLGQVHILPYHLKDEASVRRVTEGRNVVINLVGAPWETRNFSFQDAHVDGAALIAQAAADAGADRLIHVSHLAQGSNPDSGFATSKAEGEAKVKQIFPEATILRPATLFGEGDRFFSSAAALGKLLPLFPLVEGGTTKRSPVWVNDVASAVLNCLHDPDTAGNTFELQGPQAFTLEQLYTQLFDQINVSTTFVHMPLQIAKLNATVFENAPILGRSAVLVKDDVLLAAVDELGSDGALGFSELGIEPESLDIVLGKATRRFRKDAIRAADAGMQI